MNIVTAPIAFLLAPLGSNFNLARKAGEPSRASDNDPYLRGGILICLLVIVAGFYFLFSGAKGDVVLSGQGYELKTGTAGIALVVLGLLFYLGMGWIIEKRSGP